MPMLQHSNGALIAVAAKPLPVVQFPDNAVQVEIHMLDLLMLALGVASFALLALYLVACERG